MHRPLHIWITFFACLSLLLAATGWVVWHTLGLERAREMAAMDADRQERVRLALWRMDFQASSLLLRENARPPHDFRAFHAPEGVVGKDNDLFKKGEVLAASSLLTELPENVLLHFQIDAAGTIKSPQVPQNSERDVALALFVDEDALKRSEQRLQTLRTLLAKPADKATNRDVLMQHACVSPLEIKAKADISATNTNLLRNNNWASQQGLLVPEQQTLNSTENFIRSRAVAQQSEEAIKQQNAPQLKTLAANPILAEKPAPMAAKAPSLAYSDDGSKTRTAAPAAAAAAAPIAPMAPAEAKIDAVTLGDFGPIQVQISPQGRFAALSGCVARWESDPHS
ncbi:MAG: hypothetical protein IPK32_16600 [Verrucomicrobiaceae bacterium]|nr:hypothetical protein [Verrucomicrobiaceae bacterium]